MGLNVSVVAWNAARSRWEFAVYGSVIAGSGTIVVGCVEANRPWVVASSEGCVQRGQVESLRCSGSLPSTTTCMTVRGIGTVAGLACWARRRWASGRRRR